MNIGNLLAFILFAERDLIVFAYCSDFFCPTFAVAGEKSSCLLCSNQKFSYTLSRKPHRNGKFFYATACIQKYFSLEQSFYLLTIYSSL